MPEIKEVYQVNVSPKKKQMCSFGDENAQSVDKDLQAYIAIEKRVEAEN